MITDREFKKYIKQAINQYDQIHPKWVYFLLMDLWEKYQALKEKKPRVSKEMELLEDIHQRIKKLI